MKHAMLSTLIFVATLATSASAQAADTEVEKLKVKVANLTAEANALWVYVQSSGENPNIAALNRAMSYYQKRVYGRKK